MSRSLFQLVSVAVTAVVLSGCGTVASTLWLSPEEGGQRVYGGVRADCDIIHDASKPDSSKNTNSGATVLLSALDMPFSLVGDTVALPLTITCSLLRPSKTDRDPNWSEPSAKPNAKSTGSDQ